MDTRSRSPRSQGNAPVSRRPGTDGTRRPAQTITRSRRGNITSGLPVEGHRAVASAVLALLIILSLFFPSSYNPPSPAPFLTPRYTGASSVSLAGYGDDLERSIFPYLPFIERSRGTVLAIWPDASTVLQYAPSDIRTRKAILGQIYASSSGNLNIKIKDSGLESNPAAEKLQGIETLYGSMGTDKAAIAVNGISAILLVRSVNTDGTEQKRLERLALSGFQEALNQGGPKWQFTYNWALASLLVGNYTEAYEGMRLVRDKALHDNELLPEFWEGFAALRLGDPGNAAQIFTRILDEKAPVGGNDAYQVLFTERRDMALVALGDAQWANRNPSAAYETYLNNLMLGTPDPDLYAKWVRLGLEQHAYERLASDMAALAGSSNFSKNPRIHHDRARLLSFFGHDNEAMGEYRQALTLGENDAPLLISYGQALESQSDHNGALAEADSAIRALGKNPLATDMADVARAATTQTTSLEASDAAQQLLDAHLLRARAWGSQNNMAAVDGLAKNMTSNASQLPPGQAGLLHLYAAFARETATQVNNPSGGEPYAPVRDSYNEAWQLLKGLSAGSPGRAAALVGLARTTALFSGSGGAQPGLQLLKDNGYDPVAPKNDIASDPDAPDILAQGSILLAQAGRKKEAANALRVAAIVRNLSDARSLSGVGRPLWSASGTGVPSNLMLQAADALREAGDTDTSLVASRYNQALSLDPALAPAWNNLGVYYAKNGNSGLGKFYLDAASRVSPNYGWGQQNLASFAYRQGPSGFFAGEAAQGQAIKALGPQVLSGNRDLRYDTRGPIPSPAFTGGDFLSRLPALLILLLLLLHNWIGNDRVTNRMGILPAKSVLGRLGSYIDQRMRGFAPALVTPGNSNRTLLLVIAIPSVIGMLGLAWGISGGAFDLFLLFLPVALLASVVAFGGNELAQRLAAQRQGSYTLHHNWLLGLLLGIVSIPFGFVYGWQAVTRVQPVSSSDASTSGGVSNLASRSRTTEERELIEEAQLEAAADEGPSDHLSASAGGGVGLPSRGWIAHNPALRVLLAGMVLNLVVALLAGAIYWYTGWPSMRLFMFASLLVLTFTSVSDPPADGWALYRRNTPLWLALFVFTSMMVTLVALKVL